MFRKLARPEDAPSRYAPTYSKVAAALTAFAAWLETDRRRETSDPLRDVIVNGANSRFQSGVIAQSAIPPSSPPASTSS